jgi:hypothetical protein
LWQNSDGLAWRSDAVEHGEDYGPSESTLKRSVPLCLVPVNYRGSCGHVFENIPCDKAFLFAKNDANKSLKCERLISINCAFCSRNMKTYCWAVNSFFLNWNPLNIEHDNINNNEKAVIHESELTNTSIQSPSPEIIRLLCNMCTNRITVARDCGVNHSIDVFCNDILQILLKKKKFKVVMLK